MNILILSDRTFDRDYAPIPALLASSGLHHHLIRAGTRTRVGLVLESGDPVKSTTSACCWGMVSRPLIRIWPMKPCTT